MFKKLVILIAILSLVVCAGTVPASGSYRFKLANPSVVKGTLLKAGDYKLTLGDAKVIITPISGKEPLEVAVKIETVDKKFSDTVIGFITENGKSTMTEIRIGGTRTHVIFN